VNKAGAIVNILLETGSALTCTACQKEFGIAPKPGESHSYCKRHLIEMWKQFPPDHVPAQQAIRDISNRPETAFAPDLSQRQPVQ